MPNIYTIQFTPAGLDYVRRLLGTRPHDEARPLIEELEQQKTAQDNPQPPVELPKGNDAVMPAAALNGSGGAPASPH
jgi:hypothetical protein